MTAILVLYEDSRGAKGTFGPHEFFLGCVADLTGLNIHALKPRVCACPVNGVSKLLDHLRDLDELSHLAPHGAPILAILDEDRLRDHAPIADMTSTDAAAKLAADSSAPTRLQVVLLERNLESVVAAFKECGERETQLIAEALKKRLNERDKLFSKVGHDAARGSIRDCVRQAMPCVEKIVKHISAAVTGAAPAAQPEPDS